VWNETLVVNELAHWYEERVAGSVAAQDKDRAGEAERCEGLCNISNDDKSGSENNGVVEMILSHGSQFDSEIRSDYLNQVCGLACFSISAAIPGVDG
jgi:hypothetical protein